MKTGYIVVTKEALEDLLLFGTVNMHIKSVETMDSDHIKFFVEGENLPTDEGAGKKRLTLVYNREIDQQGPKTKTTLKVVGPLGDIE